MVNTVYTSHCVIYSGEGMRYELMFRNLHFSFVRTVIISSIVDKNIKGGVSRYDAIHNAGGVTLSHDLDCRG